MSTMSILSAGADATTSLEIGLGSWVGIVGAIVVASLGSRVIAGIFEQRAARKADRRQRNQDHGQRLLRRLRDVRNHSYSSKGITRFRRLSHTEAAELFFKLNDAEIAASATTDEAVVEVFISYRRTVNAWALNDPDTNSEEEEDGYRAVLAAARAYMLK